MTSNSVNVCWYSYAAGAIGIVAALITAFAIVSCAHLVPLPCPALPCPALLLSAASAGLSAALPPFCCSSCPLLRPWWRACLAPSGELCCLALAPSGQLASPTVQLPMHMLSMRAGLANVCLRQCLALLPAGGSPTPSLPQVRSDPGVQRQACCWAAQASPRHPTACSPAASRLASPAASRLASPVAAL